MTAPWFVELPALLRSECASLIREFPDFRRDEEAFSEGWLEFEGALRLGLGRRNEDIPLALRYPHDFPYAQPEVIPLKDIKGDEPRFFSARHQMSGGALCLFERALSDDSRAYTSGAEALRRARIWLMHAMRGSFPEELDSHESELEAHYQRLGDVLLGPLMYGDLGQQGELVVVDQWPEIRDERYPLLVVTHVESAAGWRSEGAVARSLVRRQEPFWSDQPPSGAQRIRWYVLDREPPPVRTSNELAALLFPNDQEPLSRLKHPLAAELPVAKAVHIPVRFPARHGGGHEWLFFRFTLREASQPRVAAPGSSHRGVILDLASDPLQKSVPRILRAHDLRPQSLQLRNLGRVPASTRQFRIGLAGAGSLGSACADLLAKAGIGGLKIVDPDFLNVQNVVRHAGGMRSIGVPKAFLVAAMVSDHNLYCEVSHYAGRVLEVPSEDSLWASTAVLSTIADDRAELALNRFAIGRATLVYYLRALRSGSAGRLLRVRPGVDACLECIAQYHSDSDPRSLVVPPRDDEVITRECGQPVLASSAADLAIVGGLGVRQLLQDLSAPGEINQWVWTSEGIPEIEALRRPFSSDSVALPPHPRCAVCGVGAPRRLRIAKELRAFMVEEARRAAPNETGGILVGRRNDETVEVLFVSDAGPNAVSQPARFERDGPHCQRFLERVAAQSPGVDYVGEWHSHPGSSAAPSGRDTASFQEIAADADYLTPAPALIIVAPAASGDGVDWSHMVFPLNGRARTLDVEEVGA